MNFSKRCKNNWNSSIVLEDTLEPLVLVQGIQRRKKATQTSTQNEWVVMKVKAHHQMTLMITI